MAATFTIGLTSRWRPAPARLMLWLVSALLLALTLPWAAQAQQFPELTGRVVDGANILSPTAEAALTQKLDALETQSQRQLVVVTVPDLEGRDVADYGYKLGRHWGIGDKDRKDGVILLIAPNERRIHIAVGYGLEPVLTDALSGRIIRNSITPRFKADDYDGGVTAGVDAIIKQITLPPDEARAIADQAKRQAKGQESAPDADIPLGAIIFWLFIFFFFVRPMLRTMFRGGKRHRGFRGDSGPIIIWGGDDWGDWGGGGSGGGWGGGGSGGGWGGGGGFSGGGGSFGGGGASGGW